MLRRKHENFRAPPPTEGEIFYAPLSWIYNLKNEMPQNPLGECSLFINGWSRQKVGGEKNVTHFRGEKKVFILV